MTMTVAAAFVTMTLICMAATFQSIEGQPDHLLTQQTGSTCGPTCGSTVQAVQYPLHTVSNTREDDFSSAAVLGKV